ncbi:MAG TPA: 4-(cytidine 5'-diphospho)-2-C-methyl-D-erythritol kinase [Rhizobiaceae bacterium]|nr:4-(cytidine 5'-diphospho)-2-C-methyl-D-erythritol kinase [Rhizobiaceae bacterium]
MSSFLAPAKINLALHVVGRRGDRYHLIETLAVFTGFGDRITVSPSQRDEFRVAGPYGDGIPLDSGNLVLKARDAFRMAFPGGAPLSVILEKNLPPSSGIGGGSSDAAAMLRALRRHHDATLSDEALLEVAAKLGADLPMCLAARPLVARGIGERIEILRGFPSLPMVLVNPGVEVSTPAVFRALSKRDNAPLPSRPPSDPKHLFAWLEQTRNDLQSPACGIAPPISDVLRTLENLGAAFARMSGSGATCFGLFETMDAAQNGAGLIRERQPDWFVTETRSMASTEDPDDGN